jgi:hypothetical protein
MSRYIAWKVLKRHSRDISAVDSNCKLINGSNNIPHNSISWSFTLPSSRDETRGSISDSATRLLASSIGQGNAL